MSDVTYDEWYQCMLVPLQINVYYTHIKCSIKDIEVVFEQMSDQATEHNDTHLSVSVLIYSKKLHNNTSAKIGGLVLSKGRGGCLCTVCLWK